MAPPRRDVVALAFLIAFAVVGAVPMVVLLQPWADPAPPPPDAGRDPAGGGAGGAAPAGAGGGAALHPLVRGPPKGVHSAAQRHETARPATEKPATEKPATEKPATERPATEKPAAPSRRVGGPAAPVVIGGMAGSGTRSVAALVRLLGVNLVFEHGTQFDLEGAEFRGWPQLLDPILRATRATDYELTDLDATLAQRTERALSSFADRKRGWAEPGLREQGLHTWGFKAPATVALLPFWQKIFPRIKYIHVLRDGRDQAFSANQDDVTKMYHLFFPQAGRGRGPVDAAKLWVELNMGAARWGRRNHGVRGFEVLQVHAEDMYNATALEYLIPRLIDFISDGAVTLSNHELCCVAYRASHTVFGSFDPNFARAVQAGKADISSRRNKWIRATADDPGLRSRLQAAAGKDGALEALGYGDKADEYLWERGGNSLCTLDANCPVADLPFRYAPPGAPSCKRLDAHDFRGVADLRPVLVVDFDECCAVCRLEPRCNAFVLDRAFGTCFLKSVSGNRKPAPAKETLVLGQLS